MAFLHRTPCSCLLPWQAKAILLGWLMHTLYKGALAASATFTAGCDSCYLSFLYFQCIDLTIL